MATKKKAAKKPRAIQEMLPDVDTAQREAVAHKMLVELTGRAPGSCVGNALTVVACPVCGLGALAKRDKLGATFTHRGYLQSTAKSVKWSPDRGCRVDASKLLLLISAGDVAVNKAGSIVGTRYRKTG